MSTTPSGKTLHLYYMYPLPADFSSHPILGGVFSTLLSRVMTNLVGTGAQQISIRLSNGKLHNPKMAASLVKITEPNLQYEEYILWKPS